MRSGDFFHHLFEKKTQMCVRPVIRRGDVFDAIGVGRKLITFSETGALRIVRIVNGDCLSAVLSSSP